MIAGDFNAKHLAWNSNNNDATGKHLLKLIDKHNLHIVAPDTYTHFPRNGRRPNVLDFAVHNLKINIDIEVLNDLDSDHLPIAMTINSSYTPLTIEKYNFKNADWNKFTTHIDKYSAHRLVVSCSFVIVFPLLSLQTLNH